MNRAPRLLDVVTAHRRLRGRVRTTAVEASGPLSAESGAEVLIKWENQQVTGSFKARGALNTVDSLSEAERARGVVTASSGNHAQGLSWAAAAQGVPATIVVPETTPETKKAGARTLGAELIVRGSSYDDAEAHAWTLAEERGAVYVHSYDDPRIIAGQGTVALEALLEHPDLEAIVVPVGGGGLISGIAVAAKAISPQIRIIGIQPEVSAKFGASFAAGHRVDVPYRSSWADGLPGDIGELNLQVVLEHVDDFAAVSEDSIAEAVAWLARHHRQMIEGSGAVGVAAFQQGLLEDLRGKKVLTVATGGNIDADRFAAFLQR
ncbi:MULTISPECIES: threonine/serine dehydratase [Actinomycetes]|uniref:Threonine/serine dehydratase n=2 Tax=Actinomycetes TaxID=1760 RepID=A0ABP6M285_9MICC